MRPKPESEMKGWREGGSEGGRGSGLGVRRVMCKEKLKAGGRIA